MSDNFPVLAIFDCNVLLQSAAYRNNRSSACFQLVESGHVRLFVSNSTLEELRDVLNRDYIREAFRYDDEIVAEFINKVRYLAIIVEDVQPNISLPRDVDDEQYLNLAIEANAEFIVTRDNDLLDLMTAHDASSKEFRQKTRPLKIVEPDKFLELVEKRMIDNLAIRP